MANKETIYIPPDHVSREEILAQLDTDRIRHYQYQLECIRVSNLPEAQKRIQSSFIHLRIQAIENARVRN